VPFEILEPLAPDACRSDPSAPCHYWHLKLRALNGGRDKLSRWELDFVGVDVGPIHTPGGWQTPNLPSTDVWDLGADLSEEQSAVLHRLMDTSFLA
jgi:hypothetical protein